MQELFQKKYAEIEKSLFLVALGYLHNTEDAKDCVQEAVFSAWRGFSKLKNIDFFKTWLTRIVINKCKNCIRKRCYTEELTDNANLFTTLPTEETEILSAVCCLPPAQSVYITLRFYQDMTYEEMAKTLQEPMSTVKYKTKKALKSLGEILKGDA